MKAQKFVELQKIIQALQQNGFKLIPSDNYYSLQHIISQQEMPYQFHSLSECQSFVAGFITNTTKQIKPKIEKKKPIGFI